MSKNFDSAHSSPKPSRPTPVNTESLKLAELDAELADALALDDEGDEDGDELDSDLDGDFDADGDVEADIVPLNEAGITFESFDLPPVLAKTLEGMGYSKPTPVQAEAIPHALAGRDVLATAQTGTGKTAAFAVPILSAMLKGKRAPCLILAPTRELAEQIAKVIEQLTVNTPQLKTVLIIGGSSYQYQTRGLRAKPAFVVGTPGRLIDQIGLGNLKLNNFGALVLDEADRMLDMGFAPQLEQIITHMPAERQTLLFSATLPNEIKSMAARYMKNPERVACGEVSTPVDRIKQEVVQVDNKQKAQRLLEMIDKVEGTLIIFTRTKSRVEQVMKLLMGAGHHVARIHGDRSQRQRGDAIRDFRNGHARILVATDIAARGIDIPHIAFVVNFDLPLCPEDYIHRIGRTARAGKEGTAWAFVTPEENGLWGRIYKMMYGKFPEGFDRRGGGRNDNQFGGRGSGRFGGGRGSYGGASSGGRFGGRSSAPPRFERGGSNPYGGRPQGPSFGGPVSAPRSAAPVGGAATVRSQGPSRGPSTGPSASAVSAPAPAPKARPEPVASSAEKPSATFAADILASAAAAELPLERASARSAERPVERRVERAAERPVEQSTERSPARAAAPAPDRSTESVSTPRTQVATSDLSESSGPNRAARRAALFNTDYREKAAREGRTHEDSEIRQRTPPRASDAVGARAPRTFDARAPRSADARASRSLSGPGAARPPRADGERRPFVRPESTGGERGERPAFGAPRGDRAGFAGGGRRSFGGSADGARRPFGARPFGARPFGARPSGDGDARRSFRPEGGARPARPAGDSRSFGSSRGPRPGAPFVPGGGGGFSGGSNERRGFDAKTPRAATARKPFGAPRSGPNERFGGRSSESAVESGDRRPSKRGRFTERLSEMLGR